MYQVYIYACYVVYMCTVVYIYMCYVHITCIEYVAYYMHIYTRMCVDMYYLLVHTNILTLTHTYTYVLYMHI